MSLLGSVKVLCTLGANYDGKEYKLEAQEYPHGCGEYAVVCDKECTFEAIDDKFCEDWFTSPVLGKDLLDRINSVRLVTESHDQGSASLPSHGNWTWFELGIGGGEEGLRWLSHENGFLTDNFELRHGRVFDRRRSLKFFESLKPDDFIQVRLGACFTGWKNFSKKGYLVFGIDCETVTRNPRPANSIPSCKISTQLKLPATLNGWHIQQETTTGFSRPVKLLSGKTESGGCRLVVVDPDDLPDEKIERNLSWDQATEDVWRLVKRMIKPDHVLIRLGYEGAIYKGPKDTCPLLIYEPGNAIGHFLQSYSDDDLKRLDVGRETLKNDLEAAWFAGLTASLRKESMKSLGNLCETQIKEAVTTGLRWSRRFAAIKFPKSETRKPGIPTWDNMEFETAADPLLMHVRVNSLAGAENPRNPKKCSLITENLPYGPGRTAALAAWDLVKKGEDFVLPFVPTARFGKDLVTADRYEIDGFRKIANAIEGYLSEKAKSGPFPEPPLKPLSFAVFGQPGSGKSFGVKQVIRTILGRNIEEFKELEFNLSQFQTKSDLRAAFETIRDQGISHKLPVVLFDEFDVTFQQQPRYWLRHLWEPMEHGIWRHEDQERHLGAGIYIFIGGTAKTLDDFAVEPPALLLPADVELGALTKSLEDTIKPLTTQSSTPPIMQFTISPLDDYPKLQNAFYRIRDTTSSGKIPIVFFRDFDTSFQSEPLGWLKFFLSPMQDGQFFDNGCYRPLGQAVFVFVEGTSGHFKKFLTNESDSFKNAKGPDFVSRLRGCLAWGQNAPTSATAWEDVVTGYVKGKDKSRPLSLAIFREDPFSDSTGNSTSNCSPLQPRKRFDEVIAGFVNIRGPNKVADGDDMFIIRRAILLRSMLKRRYGPEVQISDKILYSLLSARQFRHGARSLEAILAMISKDTLENGLLKEGQLNLHLTTIEAPPNNCQLKSRLASNLNSVIEKSDAQDVNLPWCSAEIEWTKFRAGIGSVPKDRRWKPG